ncbi:MAG: hypothetical protein Q9190_003658 [Brigantiaea leucoxantha]
MILSGVGRASNSDPDPPANPKARYDDPDYSNTAAMPISDILGWCRFRPHDFSPDFMFHEACWKLLQAFQPQADVSIQALAQFCRSCPIRDSLLKWGHEYGGVTSIDPHALPWEDYYTETALIDSDMDPLDKADIAALLEECAVDDDDKPRQIDKPPVKPGLDAFGSLPNEVLDIVLCCLPSTDVRSVRLASRTFASMILSRSFWASRFSLEGEFGFLFDLMAPQTRSVDINWTKLYKIVQLDEISQGLRCRRRIWNLLRPLARNLQMYDSLELAGDTPRSGTLGVDIKAEWTTDNDSIQGSDGRPTSQSTGEPSTYNIHSSRAIRHFWKTVAAQIEDSAFKNAFMYGCQSKDLRSIAIPYDIGRVSLSFVMIGKEKYVAGIRFKPRYMLHHEVSLGYVLPSEELTIELPEEARLHGFHVAQSARGIRAVRVVTNISLSDWLGCASGEGIMVTERLESSVPVSVMSANFDVSILERLPYNVYRADPFHRA